MKKALVTLALIGIAISLLGVSVMAANWQEDRSGVQFKVDSKTGNTQIGFYLFMKYSPIPNCIEMTIDWIVYPLSTSDTPLATDSHRIRRHCGGGIGSISTLSPFITPVPGKTYVGRIVLHDVANNLTYDKKITYVTPITLPTGIGINVTTPTGKTEDIDFTGINDQQLSSLNTYWATISASYVQTASDVAISDFFSTYSDEQPQWVFVIVQLGPQINRTGPGISVHASYNRLFFVYLIDGPQGAKALLNELSGFTNTLVGSVWLAKTEPSGGAPKAVFVEDQAWKVLQEASKEWHNRHK